MLASFSDVGLAGFNNSVPPEDLPGVDAVGALIGLDLKAIMSSLDKLLSINVFTDDDVELHNRVTLSSIFPPDEHGPVARIEPNHQNRSVRTVGNRQFLVKQAVQLLRAAGASKVYHINLSPLLAHLHSTMRMGLSENDSVLDANGEARWVNRLFITDGSALANSLGGPNPALTIQALATRTAERIFQKYFGGDPWVGNETPISSVDIILPTEANSSILGCDYCHKS